MRFIDKLKMSLEGVGIAIDAMRQNKVRAGLTILGVAVGVFVGFDTPKTLGPNETGASVAVPIFRDFMMQALKDKPEVVNSEPHTSWMIVIKLSAPVEIDGLLSAEQYAALAQ